MTIRDGYMYGNGWGRPATDAELAAHAVELAEKLVRDHENCRPYRSVSEHTPSMSNANEHQIGGQHYKGKKFQPWDWDKYGIGTHEMDIIHYVTRQKNGKEDLQKALHYLNKLREEFLLHDRRNKLPWPVIEHRLYGSFVADYCDEWGMNYFQRRSMWLLIHWRTIEDLNQITQHLLDWIADAYPNGDVCPAVPVEAEEPK